MKQATKPSAIKPIQARAYVPSVAMRQVAERAKFQPRLASMTSNVSNFRHMGE
ncbi:hypothetical protein D3C87_823290 [compost metagenome]